MSAIERAYSMWCDGRFALPNDDDIDALEKSIYVRFPIHYRDYLLNWNGGTFSSPRIVDNARALSNDSLRQMNGIHASFDFMELGSAADLALFDDNNPPVVLPIGTTSRNSLIMLNTEVADEDYGMIFVRTIDQTSIYLSDSMEDFFLLLRDPVA